MENYILFIVFCKGGATPIKTFTLVTLQVIIRYRIHNTSFSLYLKVKLSKLDNWKSWQ
jgi:hypothetical protein